MNNRAICQHPSTQTRAGICQRYTNTQECHYCGKGCCAEHAIQVTVRKLGDPPIRLSACWECASTRSSRDIATELATGAEATDWRNQGDAGRGVRGPGHRSGE